MNNIELYPPKYVCYKVIRVGKDDSAVWAISDDKGRYLTEPDDYSGEIVQMWSSAIDCVYAVRSRGLKPTHLEIVPFRKIVLFAGALQHARYVDRYLNFGDDLDRKVGSLIKVFGDDKSETGNLLAVENLSPGSYYFVIPDFHSGKPIYYLRDLDGSFLHIPSGERFPERYVKRYWWKSGKLYLRAIGDPTDVDTICVKWSEMF